MDESDWSSPWPLNRQVGGSDLFMPDLHNYLEDIPMEMEMEDDYSEFVRNPAETIDLYPGITPSSFRHPSVYTASTSTEVSSRSGSVFSGGSSLISGSTRRSNRWPRPSSSILGGETRPTSVASEVFQDDDLYSRLLLGLPSAEHNPTMIAPEIISDIEIMGRRLEVMGRSLCESPRMSLTQLRGLQSGLRDLNRQLDDLIRITPAVAPSPSSISTRSQREYRCQLCETRGTKSAYFKNTGSFKRHIIDQHYPQHEYHCTQEGCARVYRRRDRLRNHVLTEHKRLPRKEDLDQNTSQLPYPGACPLCSRTSSTWDRLYQCLLDHCLLRAPEENEPRSNPRGEHGDGDIQYEADEGSKLDMTTPSGTDDMPPPAPSPWDWHAISPPFPSHDMLVSPDSYAPQGPSLLRHERRDGQASEELTLMSELDSPEPMETQTSALEYNPPLVTEPLGPGDADSSNKDSTGPNQNLTDSNTSKSSQPSDDEERRSMQTNMTQPDCEDEFDLDAGIADSTDDEHIRNPGAYYRKLDLLEAKTAEICGIKENPKQQEGDWKECREGLERCREALCNLKSEGFCDDEMSFLVEDEFRPDIAEVVRISMVHIDQALFLISAREHRTTLAPRGIPDRSLDAHMRWSFNAPFGHLLPSLASTPSVAVEQLPIWQFLTTTLSVGLLSFSGSHVCRFDENLWGEKMNEIPLGQGYSLTPRELACMKDFVGGPAWVLGKHHPAPARQGLKVSLTVRDLQELWGPIWLMGGTEDEGLFLRTETGYIVPLPRHHQPDPSLEEIECHWAKSCTGYDTDNPLLLRSSSRILIGTDSLTTAGLTVNHECQAQVNFLQARIRPQLQPSGAYNAYHTLDGWDATLQASIGSYVQAGGALKWKRNPARKWKASIIEKCKYGQPNLRSLLTSHIGLELSACTGNARRVTLWDALRLSQTKAVPSNTTSQKPGTVTCQHRVADPDCIKSCWTRLFSTDDIDCSINIPPEGSPTRKEYIRRLVLNAIIALEDAGVDHNDHLQAFWPFTDNPRTHRIEATALCTRILLNPPFRSNCTENHECHVTHWPMENEAEQLVPRDHFLLGEAALTVQKIIPGEKKMIIATASGNAMENGWMKMMKLKRRKMFQEDLDCDLSTGYYVPLLVR
ncbi:uncharacterized protein N7482_000319 [Penicillium canariense]|uniref:C2H2-type domain-containing protein n=1 Tax=Penicillium canariense TaxID=189055 RepID=A0A9W9IDK5_9EURO|nr:uncharacterized protein N7482_000319 [Penicillium canariense]KAJ5174442.1 hypothetical protein N7482_000319 [Penicillium canariense]